MKHDNVLPRLALFPISTAVAQHAFGQMLTIGGCELEALADQYGTPLYVFDAATLDAAAHAYRAALAATYPGPSGITYAGKAFLCKAMARWTQRHDFWVDCTGVGEIGVAVAAGVPRAHILVHGVNKSADDLAAAVRHAGVIVVDNLAELRRLAALLANAAERPDLWLRVKPGVAVDTHAYRQTGQSDSKFGMAPQETMDAVALCLAQGLPLAGLHFHQGSHFHDPAPIGPALATVLDLVEEIRDQSGWVPQALSPGGGWGVPYHEADLPHPSIEDYVTFAGEQLAAGCRERGLPLPRLQLEPGAAWWHAPVSRSTGWVPSSTHPRDAGCSSTVGWPTTRGRRFTALATLPCPCATRRVRPRNRHGWRVRIVRAVTS